MVISFSPSALYLAWCGLASHRSVSSSRSTALLSPRCPVLEVGSWLAPSLFRESTCSAFPEFFQLGCLLVLWPFAPSGFHRLSSLLRPLLTSTQALARQISPSKVSNVSTRVVGLYLLRLSVTVGFRIP